MVWTHMVFKFMSLLQLNPSFASSKKKGIFKQYLTKHQIYMWQRGVLTTHTLTLLLDEINWKLQNHKRDSLNRMWDPQIFVISNKFHSIRGPKHFPTTKHKSQRHEELPRQYNTQRRNNEVQSISWITQKSYTHITHKTKPWVQKKTNIKFKGPQNLKMFMLKIPMLTFQRNKQRMVPCCIAQ